jgi:uncharacterized protein (TIGR03437 family)
MLAMKRVMLVTAIIIALAFALSPAWGQQIISGRVGVVGSLPASYTNPVNLASSSNGVFAYEGIADDGGQALFVRQAGQASWQKIGVLSDFTPPNWANGLVFGELYVDDDCNCIFVGVNSSSDDPQRLTAGTNLAGWKVSLSDLSKTLVVSRGVLAGWSGGSFQYFTGPKPGFDGRTVLALGNPIVPPSPSYLAAQNPDGSWGAWSPQSTYPYNGWLVGASFWALSGASGLQSYNAKTNVTASLIGSQGTILSCCAAVSQGSAFMESYVLPSGQWVEEVYDYSGAQPIHNLMGYPAAAVPAKVGLWDVRSGVGGLVTIDTGLGRGFYEVPFIGETPAGIAFAKGAMLAGKTTTWFSAGVLDGSGGVHLVANGNPISDGATSPASNQNSWLLELYHPAIVSAPKSAFLGQTITIQCGNCFGLETDLDVAYGSRKFTRSGDAITFVIDVLGTAIPVQVILTDSTGAQILTDVVFIDAEPAPPSPPTIMSFSAYPNPWDSRSYEYSTLQWSTSSDVTSVTVSPACTIVMVDAGDGHCKVAPVFTTTYTLTVTGPGGSATATTTLTVTGPGIASVANAFSFGAGAVAPGELITFFGAQFTTTTSAAGAGPLPTKLGDVQLTANGILCPLLYVSPGQINAQVPYEVNGQITFRIFSGTGTLQTDVPVASAAPGLWGNFIHPASTGWYIDQQVSAGDVVIMYGTGLGQVSPPVTTGAPNPTSPLSYPVGSVSVTLCGQSAQVAFAGLAPGLPSGVYQLNVIAPPACGTATSWEKANPGITVQFQ